MLGTHGGLVVREEWQSLKSNLTPETSKMTRIGSVSRAHKCADLSFFPANDTILFCFHSLSVKCPKFKIGCSCIPLLLLLLFRVYE